MNKFFLSVRVFLALHPLHSLIDLRPWVMGPIEKVAVIGEEHGLRNSTEKRTRTIHSTDGR